MIKKCYSCKDNKSAEEFYKNKAHSDGLASECKSCASIKNKQYHKDNIDKVKVQRAGYRKNNKEKIQAASQEYYDENFNKISIIKKSYYQDNKEEIKIERKQHYQDNKEEKIKYQGEYHKKRIGEDLNYKLACYLRIRIGVALKNNQRAGSAVADLGCSIKFFKGYIEEQFDINMTWDNHGEWHLDHIIPLASFDLSDREQFLKACHYTNYQPLWARDNLSKSNNLNWNKDEK